MVWLSGKSSEEENKTRVAGIHDLKEKLKGENDELKKIKHKLKDVQEKQKAEKEVSRLQQLGSFGMWQTDAPPTPPKIRC